MDQQQEKNLETVEAEKPAKEESGFVGKIKGFVQDVIQYFVTFNREKALRWGQIVFVVALTIILTSVFTHSFFVSTKSTMTFEDYFAANRSLMLSYILCCGLSWLFMTALSAWGVGKLLKKYVPYFKDM